MNGLFPPPAKMYKLPKRWFSLMSRLYKKTHSPFYDKQTTETGRIYIIGENGAGFSNSLLCILFLLKFTGFVKMFTK